MYEYSVWLFDFLTFSSATGLSHGWVSIVTSDNLFTCCHTETEWLDHDFYPSRSHDTDIDPTSGEQAPGAGMETTIS